MDGTSQQTIATIIPWSHSLRPPYQIFLKLLILANQQLVNTLQSQIQIMFCFYCKASQSQSAFSSEGTVFTFTRLSMAYLNSPTVVQNLAPQILTCSFLQEHTHDIKLMKSSSEELILTHLFMIYKHSQMSSQKGNGPLPHTWYSLRHQLNS